MSHVGIRLVALAIAVSTACRGGGADPSGDGDELGEGGASGSADGSEGTSGDAPPGAACSEAVPRALRLLTRREYEASVLALVPLVEGPTADACDDDAACDLQHQSCVAEVCVDDACNLHTFWFDDPTHAASEVLIAGDFNGWASTVAAGAWPLVHVEDVGAWVGKHALADGTHAYKLIVDGVWQTDPGNPASVDDGFGGQNSRLDVDCAGAPPPDPGGGIDDRDAHPARDFPVESRAAGFPFDDGVASGLVTTVHVEQYLRAAERLAARATADLGALLPCAPDAIDRACREAFVADFGRRAFRRPLEPDEVARLVDRSLAHDDVRTGLAVAIQVMLSSPNFLYRFEIGTANDDGTATLDPFERASLLAFALWGAPPDAELLDHAAAGGLVDADDVLARATAMIDDPRADAALIAFASQWLDVEHVAELQRSEAFDEFGPALAAAMSAESGSHLARVIRDGDGRFQDLLLADTTVVAPELAAIYGVTIADDAGPTEIDVPAERRAGLLGQAGVLARYAHSDRTSPVRRGVFVLERWLCQTIPPPPPVVPSIGDPADGETARDQLEVHAADPACAGCHQLIDPIGLGFEHFDAIGRWRDDDRGAPIDASGWLTAIDGSDRSEFATVPELAGLLADSPTAQACFARQTLRYVAGALEGPDDTCRIDALVDAFAAGDHVLADLFAHTVTAWALAPREVP